VVRRLAGWLLVVFDALGSGLTGMSAIQAVTYPDHLPGALAAVTLAAFTLASLGAAWLLLRRRGLRCPPTLELGTGPGERASRNPRRHLALRRRQRELETAYAATPGIFPPGATVRLGDPTPRYDPDGAAQDKDDHTNAVRP